MKKAVTDHISVFFLVHSIKFSSYGGQIFGISSFNFKLNVPYVWATVFPRVIPWSLCKGSMPDIGLEVL